MIAFRDCDNLMPRNELYNIPIPHHSSGYRWLGINHGFLADMIVHTLEREEFPIRYDNWGWFEQNYPQRGVLEVLIGTIQFETIPELTAFLPRGVLPCMNIITSNAKTRALRIHAGCMVDGLGIGFMFPPALIRKRHEIFMDPEWQVEKAIDEFYEHAAHLGAFVLDMMTTPLTDDQATALVMEAVNRYIISTTYVRAAARRYFKPPPGYPTDNTLWTLACILAKYVAQQVPSHQFWSLPELFDMLSTPYGRTYYAVGDHCRHDIDWG